MLFFTDLSFLYVVFFILLFHLVRPFANVQIQKTLLFFGSVIIICLVTDFKSVFVIAGLSIVTFAIGYTFSKSIRARPLLPWVICILFALFILRNYQLEGVQLLHRVGLSYILFRFIHFLNDSCDDKIHHYDILTFLNYILFFPTFLAGPIDEYNNFDYWQHQKRESPKRDMVKAGIFRLCVGVFKKYFLVVLLFPYAVNFYQFTDLMPWQWALLLSLGIYSLYILFDFSGYTDIAIGTAYLLGIRTPENFDWPYLSRNLSEFWRRWHMTFSRFLFRYVFIPVVTGLSRTFTKSKRLLITCIGYVVTFVLCGMWHGNSFNFIYWGLWHACGLIIYKCWDIVVSRKFKSNPGFVHRLSNYFAIIPTFAFVTVGWFFFNYDTKQINLIAHNFWKNGEEVSVQSAKWHEHAGLKLKINAESNNSFIKIKYRPVNQPFYETVTYAALKNNTLFLPTDEKQNQLYEFQIQLTSRADSSSQHFSQLGVYAEPLQIPFFKRFIGNTKISDDLDIPEEAVINRDLLHLPDEFTLQNFQASANYFEGYGWGIATTYLPNPLYKVFIYFRPENSDQWILYHENRPGKYSFAHLHGNELAGGVSRNLKPGKYFLKMQYSYNGKKSIWFETSVIIPDYEQ